MPFARPILVAAALLLAAGAASAQATRTWVSGVGDDANPCSRTAPCKTFAGAISKTAAAGTISVLDPGGYGSVTITKAITIDGGGVEGSIVSGGTFGITVSTAAGDAVTLRNLTIYGGTTGTSGIRILSASPEVIVDHVHISGFDTGIEHTSTGQLYVYDSVVSHNRQFGMYVTQGRATVESSRFDDNLYEGVRAWGGRISIRHSVASGNAQVGLTALGAGASIAVDDCLISHNAYGIGAFSSGTIIISNSSISYSSVSAIYRDGTGGLQTFGNNRLNGNAASGTWSGSGTMQ